MLINNLQDQAQIVCNQLGMDLTTAIRVFLNQLVVENGLPFQPKADPFFLTVQHAAHQTFAG